MGTMQQDKKYLSVTAEAIHTVHTLKYYFLVQKKKKIMYTFDNLNS